ncbi:MAG: C4-type zinc ribbon domain-containing protein [Bacteroidota bacterium]
MYALQQVDLKLDELEKLKGDLPSAVKDLQEKIAGLESQVKEQQDTIKSSRIERDKYDVDVAAIREKSERYKAQQFQVRTNKQYDALTKEIDTAEATIAKLEREMDSLADKSRLSKEKMEALQGTLEETKKAVRERQHELDEVSKASEEEELQLNHEREKLVSRLERKDLIMYERIRKAKDGTAVVAVKRNACGGCFNFVPAQRILELRKNNRIFTCEHCARILVSDEIVQTSANLV